MIDLSSILGGGGTSSIDKLVSQYIDLERKPVNDLQSKRDQLNVQSAMFSDLSKQISDLKDLAESLSSSTDSAFATHTATTSDSAVATVSAGSNASNGTYALTEIHLAQSQRLKTVDAGESWTSPTD